MAFTYSPKVWEGPHFPDIFSEALYANNTIDKGLVRFITSIKSETQITTLGGAPAVQPYALTPSTPQGSLNFSDATLTPVKLMVYDRFDPNQLLNTQFEQDMAAGASNMDSARYMNAVKAYLLPRISKQMEVRFWQGITTQLGAATDNIDRSGSTLTATNVIDEIKGVYAALPGEVLTTGEQMIYMPEATKQLALIANSNLQFRDILTVSADGSVKYLDCPISFVPVPANTILAGRSSDFVWGTDLLDDYGKLEVNKVSNESDQMFYKMVFTQGSTICVTSQKVLSKV